MSTCACHESRAGRIAAVIWREAQGVSGEKTAAIVGVLDFLGNSTFYPDFTIDWLAGYPRFSASDEPTGTQQSQKNI